MKIDFPLSTKEVKLHQAIKIQKLLSNEKLKASTKMVACLAEWTDTPMSEWQKVEQFQVEELFSKMITILDLDEYPDFERIIKIEGEEFGFIPNMEEIEFSEFGDIETIGQPDEDGKGGGFEVFHKIMAVLYRPIIQKSGMRYALKDYESEDSEEFEARSRFFLKYASYYQARSAIFFFLPFNRELMNSSSQSPKLQEMQG